MAVDGPGVYRELVTESGWNGEEFEQWIADALVRELLGGSSTVSERSPASDR